MMADTRHPVHPMPQEAMALIAILLFFQLYVWKKPYDATWIAGRITRSTFGAGINKDSDVRAPTVETACVRHPIRRERSLPFIVAFADFHSPSTHRHGATR